MAAAAAHNAASGWASRLHPDLIPQIGWRVLAAGDLLDYVRFRAVCALWRSTTVSPRGRGLVDSRFHPRRWLLLPEGYDLCPGHTLLLGYVRFFNVTTGFFVRAWLPIFQDHSILDVVDGLVLLLHDQDSIVRLLNPLTGDTADLPPLAPPTNLSFVSRRYLMCFTEVIATCVTVSLDGLITVMIVLPKEQHVAFATSGIDREWSVSAWSLSSIGSSVSSQGRIYILNTDEDANNEPQILQIDPPRRKETGLGLSPPKFVARSPCEIQPPYYLIEWGSDILVIGWRRQNPLQMLVYRLSDLILDMSEPLTSVGGCVLFANEEQSLSVSGKALPTVVGDTVVKYAHGAEHLGKYDLQSGTWFPPKDEYAEESGFEPSSRNLVFRIFSRSYDYNGDKSVSCLQRNATAPRLVNPSWQDDERPSGSARVTS